jgi:hypothetical protein
MLWSQAVAPGVSIVMTSPSVDAVMLTVPA